MKPASTTLLESLDQLSATELRRLLAEHLTQQKMGLYWERNAIAHDKALNSDLVLPRVVPDYSHTPEACVQHQNLIIEGDNFDSLRLLRSTHAGRIRVIYIDPPYNTGSKDWVYNDNYVGVKDRWRHSQWLEFLYQRLSLARDLLTPDGVVMVSINDDNRARLDLLMEEVFPGRRVGSLVWRTRDSTSAKLSNFSDVHEHVLIYANPGFSFNGRDKTQKKYKNPDNDPRGPWNGDPLTLAFDRFQRKNLYYPILDPKTGRWYPCDEGRVWCYASEANLKEGATLRTETMEEFVRQGKILFPAQEEVRVWHTMDELLADIDSGNVPVTPKRKRPLLSRNTPDLEFWLNKPVGFGRPLFKKHWKDLQSHTSPLSSWIARVNEAESDDDEAFVLNSPQAGEGSEVIQEIFGAKAFPYPKPLALIKNLLSQAMREGDIVLDFFAGSGTTGQAVLELNAEEQRRCSFILCSSTEATASEPDKNLCLDVCAERLRRVILGYGGRHGINLSQGGEFAYLQLDKFDAADVAFDAQTAHAATLLQLRHAGCAPLGSTTEALQCIARGPDWVLLLCSKTDVNTLEALRLWAGPEYATRLLVVSTRPKAVEHWLHEQGIAGQALSIRAVLAQGQEAPPAASRR